MFILISKLERVCSIGSILRSPAAPHGLFVSSLSNRPEGITCEETLWRVEDEPTLPRSRPRLFVLPPLAPRCWQNAGWWHTSPRLAPVSLPHVRLVVLLFLSPSRANPDSWPTSPCSQPTNHNACDKMKILTGHALGLNGISKVFPTPHRTSGILVCCWKIWVGNNSRRGNEGTCVSRCIPRIPWNNQNGRIAHNNSWSPKTLTPTPTPNRQCTFLAPWSVATDALLSARAFNTPFLSQTVLGYFWKH